MNRLRRLLIGVIRGAAYCLLVPVGLVLRLVVDPLRTRRAPEHTNWRRVDPRPATLDRARQL